MKKLFTLLLLTCMLGSLSYAQVKIGLPAGSPQISAILDLSNTGDGTRAFILPRVAGTASILFPVNGMLIYDLSSNCLKAYQNGVWSNCLSQSASAASINCGASALNGNYSQGTALTASNTVTIVVVNNTSSVFTVTPSTTDIVLTDVAAAGMSVASVSPASVSLAAGGGTSTITYTLSGTPTAAGAFSANITKFGPTCQKTGNVCLAIAPITVTNTTTPVTLPIPVVAGNTIDFTAAGGLPNTGLTWAMVSNPATGILSSPATGTGVAAQAILVANAGGSVTVTYSAVNACGVTVTGTRVVWVGDLSVNNTTSAINSYYSQNTALTAANTVTVVLVNNSTVVKNITPLNADIVLSGAGVPGMSVTSFSPASLSVPAFGGTSTITYTLGGTPTTTGSFTATWTKGALSLIKTNTVCLAIAPITVSNTTNPSTLPMPVVTGNTVNFTAAGGTPNTTGISWSMTSVPATGVFSSAATGTGNAAQAILIGGVDGNITVTFTATNACGLVVIGTQTVTMGDQLRAALAAVGCTYCAAYDAAAVNDYVQVAVAEYDKFTTVISGITNYGMKLADRGLVVGSHAYTSYMFANNIPINAIPFAFSTKLAASVGCVKLITQSSNTLGVAEVSWGSATGITLTPGVGGTFYFVIKKPTLLMPANTNIAVHGYYNGYGGAAGGSGVDGVTSSNFSTGANNYETNCTLPATSFTVLPTAGTSPAAVYFNYDIKWTSTKQW